MERIIAEHPFFEGLAGEYIKFLAGCAKNVRFNAGEYVFREGEEAKYFYLIRHGRVAIEITTPHKGAVRIQTLGPGEMLGWTWLVAQYERNFAACAVELTSAIQFDGACTREKFEQDPKLGYELAMRFSTVMAQRLKATRLQLMDLYNSDG
jgi:CRP-like cAMP-binding protein